MATHYFNIVVVHVMMVFETLFIIV